MQALDLLVVIDVAMTETARLADYVLPAPTQFEKYEATFYNFDFPRNIHHLRHPVVPAPEGLLAEPEIHARLVEAAGALTEQDYAPLRTAAEQGRAAYAAVFLPLMADPKMRRLAPVLLYRTLGPTLPEGAAAAAVLWPAAHQLAASDPAGVKQAGYGEGLAAGEQLFEAILSGSHGVVITEDEYDESWRRLPRERIQLHIPELLDAVAALPDRPVPANDPQYPYVLSAGERRAFTANTIIRDPEWRRRDPDGRLRMSNTDAERLGISSGDHVRLTTRAGSADVQVDVTDTMRAGHLALPNGLGLTVDDPAGDPVTTGVATNTLTDHRDRDEWAGTPWHKHVPASIDIIPSTPPQRVQSRTCSPPAAERRKFVRGCAIGRGVGPHWRCCTLPRAVPVSRRCMRLHRESRTAGRASPPSSGCRAAWPPRRHQPRCRVADAAAGFGGDAQSLYRVAVPGATIRFGGDRHDQSPASLVWPLSPWRWHRWGSPGAAPTRTPIPRPPRSHPP